MEAKVGEMPLVIQRKRECLRVSERKGKEGSAWERTGEVGERERCGECG